MLGVREELLDGAAGTLADCVAVFLQTGFVRWA